MKCPVCETESNGRFCPSCGTSLQDDACTACGANLVPGARFCTRCGEPVAGTTARAAGSSGGHGNLPWYVAGAVLLVLAVILVVPMVTDRTSDAARLSLTPAAGAGDAVAPGTPPPLTGTPRQQADRLFDRIMTARGRGDAAEALRFTPMAIQAYAMAAPLDDDGLYHLASVHLVTGDPASARETAEQALARSPDHLLALAVAGEAAALAGDSAAARDYYTRFLAAYDTEVASGLQEYEAHAPILPEYRAAAQQFVEQ